MASFVPYYRKKILILEKREEHLCRLLARGASEEKLLQAAETVRLARIRVQRAKQAETSPADQPEFRYRIAKCQERIDELEAMSAVAILAELRSRKRSNRVEDSE